MRNDGLTYLRILIAALCCLFEGSVLCANHPQLAQPDSLPPISQIDKKLIDRKQDSARKVSKSEQETHPSTFADSTQQMVLDSTHVSTITENLIQEIRPARKSDNYQPDPIRSMWIGLVFPGGGQIYNRRYWKLPIVYGGFLGCAYALTWNNQMLRDYQQAYLDIMDTDPNTNSYEQMLPLGYDITGKEERFKNIFKNKKNYYRKYRDMSIFAFAGVYLISIIDAYVDAELSSFDLNQDLSLNFKPSFIQIDQTSTKHYRNIPALSCQIGF